MANKGLLLVTMEPPAGLEDEFNDWYDTEHFPQRRSLPGFESGTRWVCLDGWPRWLALYDLDSLAALETEAYRAVSGPHSTPWSKRILPRTIGRQRITAEQVAPGDAVLADAAGIARLLLVRYPAADAQALQKAWSARPGVVSARVFRDAAGLWLLAGFSCHVTLAELAPQVNAQPADMVNLYMPYRR